ncbi:MAG: 2-C-methyl-D-erythritol 2,4-cyclodiphosphate synthase [Bacteroidales bacterium]|nr:2-C-methyl-D-erythritol 2,4-cyclodiphosphate synthase [Bacteroidales bacterium]
MENFRIGFGYDVHQLKPGRKLIIGGILIPFEKGPVAHSDGDVLIHSICDALLGALSLGDIGLHFPDNSDEFRDIDSKILLGRVMQMIDEKGFKVVNMDSTVLLQKPKLKNYISEMKIVLSSILSISTDVVSIKATTTEHIGFIGRGEGIAAQAVVLLSKK